jgi:hypothetical protein
VDEPNRFVHVALVKKGVTIGTTLTTIVSNILAAELAGNAYIVRNCNGTMTDAAYQEGRGAGKQSTRVLSAKHTVEFIDFNFVPNIERFWNLFKKQATNYQMVLFTSNYAWIVPSEVYLSAMPKVPITDNIETFIEGHVTVTWSYPDLPVAYNVGGTTVDTLQECQELFDAPTTLINASGSDLVIDGLTGEVGEGETVNAYIDTNTAALATAVIVDGAAPAGITIGVSGENITITGTPSETGTFEFTIKGSNATGVSQIVTVTITVI